MTAQLLFIYGTLMRGQKRHHYLAPEHGITYVGLAKIQARLFELPGEDFPGAIPSRDAEDWVFGEVYELSQPQKTFQVLDAVEACDEDLFRREEVQVWIGNKKRRAWTYFYNQSIERARPLQDGYYRQ